MIALTVPDDTLPTIHVTTPVRDLSARCTAVAIGNRNEAFRAVQDERDAPEPTTLTVTTDTGDTITWCRSRPGDEVVWLLTDECVPAYAWAVRG